MWYTESHPLDKEDTPMVKWLGHLRTVTNHKKLVRQYCFRIGLYKQGLLHDLSKFYPVEFLVGAKHFTGTRSPNDLERLEKGYSAAWLHHKGCNKHHLEYWIDYVPEKNYHMGGIEMPVNYVAEMICDRIAACRTYQKEAYTDASPYEYFQMTRGHNLIHPNTEALMEQLMLMLKDEGEDKMFDYLKNIVLAEWRARKK